MADCVIADKAKPQPACYDGFIVKNQVIKGLGLLCLVTIAFWVHYKKCGNYVALNEQNEVTARTKDKPVISALQDVKISSDETDCRRLFGKESSAHGFNMSKEFQENIAQFLSAVRANVHENMTGHSYQVEIQYKLLHYLVTNLKFVRTVCETGFNAGHSSFNYLTARRDVRVYSFDIGKHRYTRPMISYLQRKFPGRLKVTLGDSRTTLLQYLQSTTPLTCDMILVDGGHSVEVALADIRNFALLASQPHNVMIVDDMHETAVATAWKIALRSGIVQEIYHCAYGRPYVVSVVARQGNKMSDRSRY